MSAVMLEAEWDVPRSAGTAPDNAVAATPSAPPLDDWIRLPMLQLMPAPEAQLQVKEVIDWTGMSRRQLSELLGTGHPTVSALIEGHATQLARRPDVRERLHALHALCERLAPLVGYQRDDLAAVLFTAPEEGEARIVDLATADSPALAYLAALKYLKPQRARSPKYRYASVREGTATTEFGD